jgi:hypothetical protein
MGLGRGPGRFCLGGEVLLEQVGFTSTEVVYGVTGTDVIVLPEYGVSP